MERIGHYRIVEEMGRGGMGVVYKAYEESLSRFVAIKVLGEHLTQDPQFVKRFQREAQAAARISHPNIVPIYYVGEDADRHYFAMEYLTGGSLESELRKRGRVEPLRAAKWMLETARGLTAAHAEGLIHRDIKPANLMLDREGHVKIGDFGLAKATTQSTRLTGTGLFLGSPGYLSPEQCRGEELDGRSDIYSLGVTFYELLSGQIPFSGDSPAAMVLSIIQSEPPAIEDLNPHVDPELRRILGRMIAKDRGARIASARELVQELKSYVSTAERGNLADTIVAVPTRVHGDAGLAPTVVGSAPTQRAEAPAEATAIADATVTDVPEPRRSQRLGLLVATIMVAAIFITGAAGWALWSWMRQGLRDSGAEASTSEAVGLLDHAGTHGTTSGQTSGDQPPDGAATDELQPAVTGGVESSETESAGAGPPGSDLGGEPVNDRSVAASQSAPDAELPTTESVPPKRSPAGEAPPATTPTAASGSIAVVALGERLMAGPVERYLEERLGAHGYAVVDEKSTEAGMTLFQGDQDPPVKSILTLLRPHAARLVLVDVEYLGERSLSYLGRGDVVYRSRISIRALDLAGGVSAGIAVEEEVEYTALNVDQAARDALGAAVRRFVAGL